MTEAGMSVDIGKGTVSGEMLVLFFPAPVGLVLICQSYKK
jgi:hypothetical protein